MQQHYLPNWHDLVDALANAAPTIGQPDLRSVIAEILAEIGNVVPEYCREETALALMVAA